MSRNQKKLGGCWRKVTETGILPSFQQCTSLGIGSKDCKNCLKGGGGEKEVFSIGSAQEHTKNILTEDALPKRDKPGVPGYTGSV